MSDTTWAAAKYPDCIVNPRLGYMRSMVSVGGRPKRIANAVNAVRLSARIGLVEYRVEGMVEGVSRQWRRLWH